MIQTAGLTKKFGEFSAVAGIDLSVARGEVLALLGPNGAGKTTTVRMLASILKPSRGWATVAGYDTVRDAKKVRHTVGLLTEFPGLYLRMRGWDYLDFFGRLQGLSADQRRQRSEQLLKRFELWDDRNRTLGQYSKGMRQKLALTRAMLHDPSVLFLDEPTSAMDPHSARLVRDAILDLRQERKTVILCTHNLSEAETLADRIAIIRRGRIVALGSPEELKNRLMGDPILELRLGQALDGILPEIEGLVRVEEVGGTWLRYRAADPLEMNPHLLTFLAQQGVPVVTLSEVPRSLEEVYLKIVNDGNTPESAYDPVDVDLAGRRG